MTPEAALKANEMMEHLEEFGPVAAALLATFGIAYVAYMLYQEWKERKIQKLQEQISELREENAFLRGLCGEKDEQLNKALTKQCAMAYKANDADARAEGHRKRADKMAEEAEKYRRMAGVPAA